MADKLRAIGAANSGLKKKLGNWAKSKGLKNSKARLMGGDGAAPFAYGLANKARKLCIEDEMYEARN